MIGDLDFDLDFRTSGRARKSLEVEVVRDITPADLALLSTERAVKPPAIQKLRDRHHALARYIALGRSNAEMSLLTGYDPSRISILRNDPTFQELVKQYQSIEEDLVADFVDRATTLSISAVNEIQDRLEESPEDFSIPTLLEVAKFAADRTGHAPVTKVQQNLNVNVGLADRMEAARRRLAAAPHIVSVTDISNGD